MKSRFTEGRNVLTLVLLAAFVWSLTTIPWGEDLIHAGGGPAFVQFVKAALTPELSPTFLQRALLASWQTLAYATASMTLAIAIGLPLGIVAAGALATRAFARLTSMYGVRVILAFLRSIHELVWAWLFVVAFGLSPMAGILALAIPYGGILGRVYAEVLQDVPEAPLRALRAAGASEWKVFLYGRFPMALPDLLSYGFYRWECSIRSAAILSFVGIPGLGYLLQVSLIDLKYSQVWTLLAFMVVIIVLVESWSNMVRRRLAA